MNKSAVYKALAKTTGMSVKDVKSVMEAFQSVVTSALKKGETVALTGFGKFARRGRKERKQKVPGSDKVVTIKAHNVPVFKAGKALKEAVK